MRSANETLPAHGRRLAAMLALLVVLAVAPVAAQDTTPPAEDAVATDARSADEPAADERAAGEPAVDEPAADVATVDVAAAAVAVEVIDPALLPSEMARLATKSLLLGITESDQRAVAVGERGHIVVSESRDDWRQVENVPTRTTLTAATALGSDVWAVGHAQVILHSADGGLSWERQHVDPYDPEEFEDIANGAPLLDVLFLDAHNGLAIGAYGLLLHTSDGGASWSRGSVSTTAAADAEDRGDGDGDGGADGDTGQPADDAAAAGEDDSWTFSDEDLELEELSDPHLNAIARTGNGGLLIVAERGSAFRSRDQGRTWERLLIPYDGSMFGVLGFDGDRVLVFGLRGNVFESADLGSTWTAVDSGTEQSLQGGTVLADGGAALVGSNGVVLVRRSGEEPFVEHSIDGGGALADAVATGGSGLVVVGERGVSRFRPN